MTRIIPGIVVKDPEAAKVFYTRHLAARVVFDAGWYVSLRLGGREGPEVAFTRPHDDQDAPIAPGALSLYVEVDDVDAAHARVRETGLDPVPPSDKPWGDRSFTFQDPNGVRVYLFSPRPLSPEFARFLKD